MAETARQRFSLSRAVQALPADLVGILVLAGLTTLLVFLPGLRDTQLQVALGLPFVLFVPGYAFVAALFPGDGDGTTREAEEGGVERSAFGVPLAGGIGGMERVVLSVGLSIAIVPLVGFLLGFTRFGIRLDSMTASLDAVVLIATAVAMGRRKRLPADERYRVSLRAWYAAARSTFLDPDTRGDAALNVLLAASVLLAGASAGYAFFGPEEEAKFTEFYVLTEADDGDLVAADYPTEFVNGESKPIVVGLENHENEPVEYTVVVQLERMSRPDDSGIGLVSERTELERFTVQTENGERITRNISLRPTMTGERLRIVFLLYKSDVPANPTRENAYRDSHLWVNVSAENASGSVENASAPAKLLAQRGEPGAVVPHGDIPKRLEFLHATRCGRPAS